MPPAGGFPKIEYVRSLPVRGPGGRVIWAVGTTVFLVGMALIIRGREIERCVSLLLLLFCCLKRNLPAPYSAVETDRRYRRMSMLAYLQAEDDLE